MIDVCALPLSVGAHSGPDEGMCVMEMAAYVARESWTDEPQCVSPVIASIALQESALELLDAMIAVGGPTHGPTSPVSIGEVK